MSFLGGILGGVKNAVVGVGHAVGDAASNPWVKGALAAGLAATGVGAPLAAGIMGAEGLAGGALKRGGGIMPAVAGGVTGAAEGYGASKLGAVLHGGGSLLDKAGGLYSAASGMGGGAGSIPGALGSLGLGGGGGSGGGGVDPKILALAGLQAANAASLGKQANDYSDKAWSGANDSYTARAGLRDAGIKGLTSAHAPDLSSLSAIRAQNPVAAKAGVAPPPTSAGFAPSAPAPVPAPIPAAAGTGSLLKNGPGMLGSSVNGSPGSSYGAISPQAPHGGFLRSALTPPPRPPMSVPLFRPRHEATEFQPTAAL